MQTTTTTPITTTVSVPLWTGDRFPKEYMHRVVHSENPQCQSHSALFSVLQKDLEVGSRAHLFEAELVTGGWYRDQKVLGRYFVLGFGPQPPSFAHYNPECLYSYDWEEQTSNLANWKKVQGVTVQRVFNNQGSSRYYHDDFGHNWVVTLTTPGVADPVNVTMPAWIAETCFDITLEKTEFKWNGQTVGHYQGDYVDLLYSGYHPDVWTPSYEDFYGLGKLGPLSQLHVLNHQFMGIEGYAARVHGLKKPGLSKIYKAKLKAMVDEMAEQKEWVALIKLCALFKNSGRTIEKVKVSKVLNEEFGALKTTQDLLTMLEGYNTKSATAFIETLPSYRGFRKTAVKKNADRALTKIFDELQEMPFTADTHPTLYAAVSEGNIPLSIFFPTEKGETYFLINDQFDLWEEMLGSHNEMTCKIASEASRRKHYEKDLMSYFYFVLYALPEYLERHTGRKWTCIPRLVESEYELEPEAQEEDRGVIKKRSALTPVADNQKNTVVVPYTSMAIHGRMTTYCYSHEFHVLERGLVKDGHVITKDLEEKLNGKDDYGLMYYTFTGSYTARGYPTFLIIFERLKQRGNKTRVHFHRVHPMRSKDGDQNPIGNWTQVCYNWMIGNVHKDRIAFQQGDLAFIRLDPAKQAKIDMSAAKQVTDYDSHAFQEAVAFLEYNGKVKHVLGHVEFTGGNALLHPEHDDVNFNEEGIFEVRQCRSWEANPRGIWTLNFD